MQLILYGKNKINSNKVRVWCGGEECEGFSFEWIYVSFFCCV